MTNNYLVQIWFFVKTWFRRIRPQAWQLVLCVALLVWGICVLIYINDIPRIRVEARVGRVSGVGHAEDISLKFRINSGLLYLRDSVLLSDVSLKMRVPAADCRAESPVGDSIRRIFLSEFGPDRNLERIQGVFESDVHLDFMTRSISQELYGITTSTWKRSSFIDKGYCSVAYGGQSARNTMDFQNRMALFPSTDSLGGADLTGDSSMTFMYPAFSAFPRFTDLWDISQRSYHLRLDLDPQRTKELSFDFLGPIELFPMDPVPDVISMSGFSFTDSTKLRRICEHGLSFHARFPQMENLQDVRIFGLTTFVSLFFTLVCTILFRIGRFYWLSRGHANKKRNG